jgi:hypothetical protein
LSSYTAVQLATAAHRITWWVAIEGIGYPGNEWDQTTFDDTPGFQGRIYCTKNLDGLLASWMDGATIVEGLDLPDQVSDSFDPSSLEYSNSGLTVKLHDVGGWLKTWIRPRAVDASLTLDADTGQSAIVDILDSGNVLAEGDVVWLAGREAVLLGTKAALGGGVYRYSLCTRGYLGTPKGRADASPVALLHHSFPAGTVVYRRNPIWHGRRVVLFAMAPDYVASGSMRVFSGTLADLSWDEGGTVLRLFATGSILSTSDAVKEMAATHRVRNSSVYANWLSGSAGSTPTDAGPTSPEPTSYANAYDLLNGFQRVGLAATDSAEAIDRYGIDTDKPNPTTV